MSIGMEAILMGLDGSSQQERGKWLGGKIAELFKELTTSEERVRLADYMKYVRNEMLLADFLCVLAVAYTRDTLSDEAIEFCQINAAVKTLGVTWADVPDDWP